MLLSLADILRCPAAHEESALVLSVETWQDQRVWAGTLGCPVCHERYGVRDGVVYFGDAPAVVRHAGRGAPGDAARLAAQLALTEPGGTVLLTGRYADVHTELVEGADVACLLLDAPPAHSRLAVNLEGLATLPLASRALRAAAVDDGRLDPVFLAGVARCLRPHGRLVAPASAPIPSGIRLIARDSREWVAESPGHVETASLSQTRFRNGNE